MIFLIITFLAFLFTIILTPYLIKILIQFNIVDNPNGEDRRIHSEPVPRLGGIVIFLVIMLVTFSFYHDISSRIFLITGTLVVFLLGLLDDIVNIKWYFKFIFQSIAAILLIISLSNHDINQISLFSLNLSPAIGYPVLFLLILSILNSFNLMDGLDGLVTGFSLIVASLVFLLSYYYSETFITFLSASIIGTSLGFLKFNGNPARIFLGDSGALTLGYLLAASVLYLSVQVFSDVPIKSVSFPDTIDIVFVLIVFAVPLTDMIRVMLRRFKKGSHIFLPDRNHLHHILYSKKIRHKTVVLFIHFISTLFTLLSLDYAFGNKLFAMIFFGIMLVILFSIENIIEFTIRKENLLSYGKKYRIIPGILPKIYMQYLLPAVSSALLILIIILIALEVNTNSSNLGYFLLIVVPAFLYSSMNLKKSNYYAEMLVFLNIIIFFVITGFNGFFYRLYHITEGIAININQIFVFVLSGMIILFVLFKERIANIRTQFLGGTDLTIGVFIFFVYVAIQFIEFPNAYKISDTLLRSFLLFIFYKIIILTHHKLHFSLYYLSFLIAVIAIGKSLF